MFILRRYLSEDGKDIFGQWLGSLKDLRAKARVLTRLDRLCSGLFGDCKTLRDGVSELRIDYGPGYRVYYAKVDKVVLLLLAGGDKRTQSQDIEKAVAYLADYKRRPQDG